MLRFAQIWNLIHLSIGAPREGIRGVLKLELPREALWPLLLLQAISSACLTFVSLLIVAPGAQE